MASSYSVEYRVDGKIVNTITPEDNQPRARFYTLKHLFEELVPVHGTTVDKIIEPRHLTYTMEDGTIVEEIGVPA